MKRVFGIAFTESEIKGSKVLNAFVHDTNIRGEIDPYSIQEHTRWLISKEDMENLYSQLQIALGKAK
ncbi:hypothetical protein [Escherichia coli]|uniref:hypothetical protein n=1 Tax=Escherichia coli TaxID=562 RepID=UPI000DF2EE0E|nr:hypothetical protein [Escherichia coli]EFH2757051.1 hypothetical protein [Escherichia coli]EHN4965318.1 hypothetical protein [Escherichia coli]MBN6244758.1 hypothetical protein [Escherichia coli]MCW9908930.1 hypothetical protein [Escherichia coli]